MLLIFLLFLIGRLGLITGFVLRIGGLKGSKDIWLTNIFIALFISLLGHILGYYSPVTMAGELILTVALEAYLYRDLRSVVSVPVIAVAGRLAFMMVVFLCCNSIVVDYTQLSLPVMSFAEAFALMLMAVVRVWLIFIIDRDNITNSDRYIMLFSLFFTVFAVIYMLELSSDLTENGTGIFLLFVITLVLIGTLAYVSFRLICLQFNRQDQERLLDEQLKAQNSFIEVLQRQYNELRMLRHDYNNHMNVIKLLYINEEFDKFEEYLDNYYRELNTSGERKVEADTAD